MLKLAKQKANCKNVTVWCPYLFCSLSNRLPTFIALDTVLIEICISLAIFWRGFLTRSFLSSFTFSAMSKYRRGFSLMIPARYNSDKLYFISLSNLRKIFPYYYTVIYLVEILGYQNRNGPTKRLAQ